MKVDCVIVGFGLAGMAFAKELEDNNKTFIVFEDTSQTSSNVAGGVYNPIILKRFTPVWQAKDQLDMALPFYREIEEKLNGIYDYTFPTHRIFKSIEEQNNWFSAADRSILSDYMDTNIVRTKYNGVLSPEGMGRVKGTGRIDTKKLLDDYKIYLENRNQMEYSTFDYDAMTTNEVNVIYKSIETSNVVFCEGYGMLKNPYFRDLPMNEVKGELITIHAPDLEVDFLIKSSVFVIPLGNYYFKVGATFNWKDKTLLTTDAGKLELLNKLDSFISVPYTVVKQSAGIRPTVKDRRPLVGLHSDDCRLSILNGLGTRGVMIAPKVAKELFAHIYNGSPLDPESDISRFLKD